MKIAFRCPALLYGFPVLAGLAGAGLVIVSISLFGPGLTHDSTAYVFAAKSLLEGNGFEYFGYPSPFIQWPPLYPVLLATAHMLGIGYMEAAGAINAAAHGLIIVISGYWLYSILRYGFCAIFGIILLVFSLPLIQVSKYLWTETTFVLFFILFCIYFEKFARTRRCGYLVKAGIFTALACIDRYAGITIVLVAAVFLIFQNNSFFIRVRDIFIFGVISCLPLTVWIARNYIVSSTLLGVRLPSTYELKLNIKRVISSVYSWIAPDDVFSKIIPAKITLAFIVFTVLIPAVITTAFLLLSIYTLIEKSNFRKKTAPDEYAKQKMELVGKNYAILLMAAYGMIYILYLLASATKILFEPINSRYLIPIYIPMLLIFIFSLDFLMEKFDGSMNNLFMRKCVIILAGLFLIYPALNTIAAVRNYSVNGAGGYSSKAMHGNELIAYVRQNLQACTYYSNSADAVSALTGIRTYYPPKKNGPYMYGVEQFKKAVENDRCSVIIWFNGRTSSAIYDIDDIRRLYKLETVVRYEKGAVYRIVK